MSKTNRGEKTNIKRTQSANKRSLSANKSAKLTRKQKAFADYLLNNPKATAQEATLKTYNPKNKNVARSIGSENLTKPNIIRYLNKHTEDASNRLVDLMKLTKEDDIKDKRLGYDAITQVLDRTVGKPTQTTEVTSKNISITLDLSGD